ncbi:MAG: hypothetical protein KA010_02920, partial [Saprospiraceae bacterium]|nr:hypothetical protein [Saprospiraceae bacterium]
SFLIIVGAIGSVRVGIILLLFNVMMITHTFYWTQSELPQGIALMLILVALIDYVNKRKEAEQTWWLFPISVLLLFVSSFTHPLLIIPFTYIIFFLYVSNDDKVAKFRLLSYFFTFVGFFILKIVFFKTTYDSGAFGALKDVKSLLPQVLTLTSSKNFYLYLFKDYYFLLVLMLVNSWYYWKQKSFVKLIGMWVFELGFIALVNMTYAVGSEQFYLENQYLILQIFLLFPFVFDVLPSVSDYKLVILLSSIAVIGFLRIYSAHGLYTQRLHWFEHKIQEFESRNVDKVLIPEAGVPKDTLLMTWGSCYEFWLLSTLEHNHSMSVIVEEKQGEYDWALNSNKAFLSKWGLFDYKEMDPKYFIFKDTVSTYKKL